MTTLLIYDIPHDGLRAKVADACLDYGLARVQYSAFVGEFNHNRQQEILQRLWRLVGPQPARVQTVLARQPHIGVDSLVALALPVIGEQKLDGAFLGLSSQLSVEEEIAPGFPAKARPEPAEGCPLSCPYDRVCHPSTSSGWRIGAT